MKCVMLSIRPKYCELIANGKKTVEVRKTKPKIDVPFKCYIYCTTDKRLLRKFDKGERIDDEHFFDEHVFVRQNTWIRGHFNPNKKVIGEFVCDAIFPMSVWYSNPNDRLSHREYPFTCLTDKEIMDYLGNGVEGYGWHISELKIYDNPKKLSEFFSVKEAGGYEEFKVINRPPQSWLYCEKIDAKPLVEGKTITIPKWEYKE